MITLNTDIYVSDHTNSVIPMFQYIIIGKDANELNNINRNSQFI